MNLNYLGHQFENNNSTDTEFVDRFTCINCKIIVYFRKDGKQNIPIISSISQILKTNIFDGLHLTCNEIIIKEIIE